MGARGAGAVGTDVSLQVASAAGLSMWGASLPLPRAPWGRHLVPAERSPSAPVTGRGPSSDATGDPGRGLAGPR